MTRPFVLPLAFFPLKDDDPRAPLPVWGEGYLVETPAGTPFTHVFAASLSADIIGPVMRNLAPRLFPQACYAILDWTRTDREGQARHEVYLGRFAATALMLKNLEPFEFRLINDGNTGFGLGWYAQDRKQFREIFLTPRKALVVKTTEPGPVEACFADLEIPRQERPRFVGDNRCVACDLAALADLDPACARFRAPGFVSERYLPELIAALGLSRQ